MTQSHVPPQHVLSVSTVTVNLFFRRTSRSCILPRPSTPAPAEVQNFYAALKSHAETIGSLPPAPPTLRGSIGSVAVSAVNRLLWWQSTVQKNFALAVCEFTRPLAQQYATVDAIASSVQIS